MKEYRQTGVPWSCSCSSRGKQEKFPYQPAIYLVGQRVLLLFSLVSWSCSLVSEEVRIVNKQGDQGTCGNSNIEIVHSDIEHQKRYHSTMRKMRKIHVSDAAQLGCFLQQGQSCGISTDGKLQLCMNTHDLTWFNILYL